MRELSTKFTKPTMNANPDQLKGTRPKAGPTGRNQTEFTKVFNVDPPAQRKTWFKDYDEEWAAFLTEKSLGKSKPGLNKADSETLPRVWNSPYC